MAELQFANFKDSDLYLANMSYSDCSGTVFDDCNLKNSVCISTTFDYALFRRANLKHACLDSATLVEADLTKANLNYASFDSATLRNADLTGANLTHTKVTLKQLKEVAFEGSVAFGKRVLPDS